MAGPFVRGDIERLVRTFTANGATNVVVPAREVTANSIIHTTLKTVGGTIAPISLPVAPVPGVGFTVVSTAGNTSVYNYVVL